MSAAAAAAESGWWCWWWWERRGRQRQGRQHGLELWAHPADGGRADRSRRGGAGVGGRRGGGSGGWLQRRRQAAGAVADANPRAYLIFLWVVFCVNE